MPDASRSDVLHQCLTDLARVLQPSVLRTSALFAFQTALAAAKTDGACGALTIFIPPERAGRVEAIWQQYDPAWDRHPVPGRAPLPADDGLRGPAVALPSAERALRKLSSEK